MTNAAYRFDNSLRRRAEDHPQQTQLTPPYILEPVRSLLGGVIDLDPCTTGENPVGARVSFAPPCDGAARPWLWAKSVFCNPPYGEARVRWVRRCAEAGVNGSPVVLLMPAHTDTRIWHEAMETASSVLFLKGRVKFGIPRANGRQVAASHPSALIGWNVDVSTLTDLGHGWSR